MSTIVPNNPYVGPRSIKAGEAFFGRDREVRSLSALLIAERIVLLHSPSGAGKSSLIQAGLTSQMRERFHVLPLIRVNLEPPNEVRTVPGLNRYILSVLLSLEEDQPPAKRLPLDTLASLTLDAYLNQCPRPETSPENSLLLFDQFEEVLTVSLTDQVAKQEFFEQLGDALQNRHRWALFAIREDYMGGLAPYARTIPNRLGVTFRLSLLSPDAAKLAIQQPARNREVDFTDSAVETLVTDLRRIQVQQPDGSFIPEEGPFVEPVQLQVVCFNLWQSHAADDKVIDEGDLQRVGNVDQALSSYYATGVESVSQSAKIDERLIRQWFGEHLITPEGIRSQVLKGAEKTEDLPNIVLRLLEDTHLVRAETRTGKTWYELSHDRLVGPVLASNTDWFEKNLSLFQRQAVLWMQKGRSEGLLLRGDDLKQAEQENRGSSLTSDEQEYLDACRKLRDSEQRERRRNRLVGFLALGTTIALVVAIVFYVQSQLIAVRNSQLLDEQKHQNSDLQNTLDSLLQALQNTIIARTEADAARAEADKARAKAAQDARLSRARELSALAIGQGDAWPQRRLLLALAAQRILEPGDPDVLELDNALREAVADITPHTALYPQAGPIYALAFRGNEYFASSGQDGIVRFWDLKNLDRPPVELTGPTAPIRTLVFSQNGVWLAAGGDDNNVYVWTIGDLAAPVKIGSGHTAPIRALGFSKDGKTLVSGGDDRDLHIWSTENMGSAYFVLTGVQDDPNATPSPTPDPASAHPTRHRGSIIAINFISAIKFRSVSEDGVDLTWALDSLLFHETVGGIDGTIITHENDLYVGASYQGMIITALVKLKSASQYDADYASTVVGTNEGKVLIVPYYWSSDEATTLVGHERTIYSVDVSDDNGLAVSGGEEGVIRLWRINNQGQNLNSEKFDVLSNDMDRIYSLSFDKPGKYFAVSGHDGDTEIWNWNDLKQKPIKVPASVNNYSALSADGMWLAQVLDGKNIFDDSALNVDHVKVLELIDLQELDAKAVTLSKNASTALAFSPDNHWLAYQDGTEIVLYDLKTKAVQLKLKAHEADLISLAFSPDSRWLVSADWRSRALLWDLSLPNPSFKELGKFAYPFYSLTFSPSGKYLGAGDTWGSLLVWNFANILVGQMEPLRLFEKGCEGSYAAIDFSIDENILAQSCKLQVFLRDTRKAYAIQLQLNHNRGLIYQVKFSPDGGYLTVGSQDSTISLYSMGHNVLESAACSMARRNLTEQEWSDFFGDIQYETLCKQWDPGK